MLYEDFEVDFFFDYWFYVEFYFSFGVKILDDLEFLVSSFLLRKVVEEEMRLFVVNFFLIDKDLEYVFKSCKVDEIIMMDCGY